MSIFSKLRSLFSRKPGNDRLKPSVQKKRDRTKYLEERRKEYLLNAAKKYVEIRSEMDEALLNNLRQYREAGIEEYEVLTSRDERVCPYCAQLEGKRFKVADAAQEKPLTNGKCTGKLNDYDQAWCRCCTVAVVR